jgi:putative ABC transport system ATP-binding protein
MELPHVAQPILRLADVRLDLESRAGVVQILKGVSLEVARGQSLAIVGPSGSGKTSLHMILAGLERATQGDVHVAGRDFNALDEDRMALARGEDIGIVFQSFHLIPTMTALENVALPLEFAGVAEARSQARALLSEVGLEARIDHFPAQLSGGEQQRVAIARALLRHPQVLLADEPTGNLDSAGGAIVLRLLRKLVDEGQTVVMVTHDAAAAALADRVVILRDGEIAREVAGGDRNRVGDALRVVQTAALVGQS